MKESISKPVVVAEIGINHNGDIRIAKSLISLAKNYGADYVKFQKRTPDICVPEEKKEETVQTPFGYPMKYIEYKHKMEFGKKEFDEIQDYCEMIDIPWFASVWDIPSAEFIRKYNVPYFKIPSACITDLDMLRSVRDMDVPIIISRGMSTRGQVDRCADILGDNLKYILHTTSSYPTPNTEMNMLAIKTLKETYEERYKIGFSNHCADLIYIVQAYIMGAEMLEFHITLDRNMKGTDQWASIGPMGFDKVMKHINNVHKGWGNGKLKVEKSEVPVMMKLRKNV